MTATRILSILFMFLAAFAKAQPPKLILPVGHNTIVNLAVFSPDGKKIVSCDATAKIWDVRTGLLLADLPAHTSTIEAICFSPDGKKFVTASMDSTARVWDASSGKLLLDLKHRGTVRHALFSGDAKKILTASHDSTAKVWDATSGKLLLDIKDSNLVSFASFSPDNKRIITNSGQTAKVWDATSGKLLLDLKGHNLVISSVQFSPDGKKIVTASMANTSDTIISVWDAQSGKLLLDLKGQDFDQTPVCFSPDGTKIIAKVWEDRRNSSLAYVWDAVSGKLLYTLKHEAPVIAGQFSYDGKKILIASYNDMSIWDANSGKLLQRFGEQTELYRTAQFSYDAEKVVSGSFDQTAKVWEANSGKLLSVLKGYTREIYSGSFSPTERKAFAVIDDNCQLWDMSTGALTGYLQQTTEEITSVSYSPSGERILMASRDSAKIWDAFSGKLLLSLVDGNGKIESALYSPDGEKIVTVSWKSIKIWDSHSGMMLSQLELKEEIDKDVNRARFSPDGKLMVAFALNSYDSIAGIWDVNSGKMLHPIDGHMYGIQSAEFSLDGKKIITSSLDLTAKIWDALSGKLLLVLNHEDQVRFADFFPNGKKIATISGGDIRLWDAVSGTLLFELKGNKATNFISFSPGSEKILATDFEKTATVWNTQTGKLLYTLEGHDYLISSAEFTPDGKRIMTFSKDNTGKIWDATTGQLIYSFFSIIADSTDYFGQIPSGFYRATNSAAKLLHYVTKDLKVITFDQLDIKYNRPDKVLEALGSADVQLIKSYRRAWEKRIKRLGIDTTQFSDGFTIPECDFENRDNIGYEQKNGTLLLRIKGIDSIYKLDRFNIWINESPIFGQRGISIRRKNSNSIDTTLAVKLSQGENRIETSITNVNGTESYRMPLLVNYIPPVKQSEKTIFIGIGIDQFADNKYNLQYSSKDIRDLSKKLKEKYGNNLTIDTLFNEKVTLNNVKALKQQLLHTTENDKVIIAYSGHGMLSKDFDYFLSTYLVNFDKPEENGLPYEELENLLDSIPARKKLMLIDACHSGEVDKEDLVTIEGSSDSLIKGFKPVAYKNEGHLGLKNSFELMQSLFVNVGKSTGATIISAASGTQFALERNDLKNGVFTYSILEAMNKYPTLKISELKKIVGERVEELTKGLQKPTSRNETIAVDWNLW